VVDNKVFKNNIYNMENNLPIYRIVIDENDMNTGVDFISLVNEPAIEENFIAFNSSQFNFKAEKEKQMLYGPLMIPNKMIYRNDQKFGEYNVYFNSDDIEIIVKKFAKNNFNNNISFEHMGLVVRGTLIENFIIKDGMIIPGFENLPVGTWFGCVYIQDEKFWNDFVKNDIVKGFSIEINGFMQREAFSSSIEKTWINLESIINSNTSDDLKILEISELFKGFKFETYNDYPKAASENAARAIRLRDEYKLKCGTLVGWQRANQLAKGENISRETIARMSAFQRHKENSKGDPKEACGPLMWLAWGGDEGIEWAQRKLKQIDTALKSSAYQTIVNRMSADIKKDFVIDVNPGENEDEFISRCIRIEIDNGYEQDQAYAICKSKWDEK
jgi:hypothetical protein